MTTRSVIEDERHLEEIKETYRFRFLSVNDEEWVLEALTYYIEKTKEKKDGKR